MIKIKIDDLITFYTGILTSLGVEESRSEKMARAQVEVHAFGTDTHGLPPLNNTIEGIKKNPASVKLPKITKKFGAVLSADCSLTPAVEPIIWGAGKAVELAGTHGIGFVSLTDGGWVGTMGYHLAEWAEKGFIMMGWNQMSSIPFVVPFGGRDARFNTSPMAFSFPTGKGFQGKPLTADFSTAAISGGKTNQMSRRGEMARDDYYLNKEGQPTRNPAERAQGGAILPFGGMSSGFRGTALAMLIEAMTCASGAVPANGEKQGGQNVHVLALSIEALAGMAGYDQLMGDMTKWVLESHPMPGGTGVRYPGQRGWDALELAQKEGVFLEDRLWKSLRELGYTAEE